MRRASVAGLELSHLKVDDLWFAGVLGLEALAFLESIRFPETPKPRWPLVGHRTRRQTIADEQDWRARRQRSYDVRKRAELRADTKAWTPAAEIPTWLADQGMTREEQPRGARGIASLYRALRKSHEDFNNYPDAADFYYGEMEMRRHGVASRSEQFILTLYWLLSGYGLRPSRAIVALLAAIGLASLGFQDFGIEDAGPYLKTLATTIEFATSLVRAPATNLHLTTAGRFLSIAVRVAGPLLIALAALALRSRVKRG